MKFFDFEICAIFLSALCIILVVLMLTWYCEKIMISSTCICIFMPNSCSKSWIVSTQGGEVLAERGSSEAVLHISVRANPPAKLRWFRNGRELSKFNPHFIMTENYLKISEISDFDNGTYVVRADNGIESGSSHAK